MAHRFCSLLVAALIASSTCLAAEGAQSQPSVAIITGEVRNPASREVAFSFRPPSGLGSSEERVALDSLNRFAFELPVSRGTLVMGYYDSGQPGWKWVRWIGSFLFDRNPLVFFVEPRDSLHITIDTGYFGPSYSFSGPNADNSRFISEWIPRFLHFRLDYEDLEVEDFKRQVDQRRREQLEFLSEGREKYSLSPGFIDYATADFNYDWAMRMISYPTEYLFANGHENRDIPPEHFDFLQEIPLVDEKAIDTMDYHTFLVRTLDWELEELDRPPRRSKGAIGRPPRDHGELDKVPVPPRAPRFSEIFDLSDLKLSEKTRAQLDSLFDKDGRRPRLSKMIDLSAVGLLQSAQARLDSMYEKKRHPKLSQQFDLSVFGLSETAQAQLDSLYEKSRSYSFTTSTGIEEPRVDTTGGNLAFYTPLEIPMDSLEKKPRLSEKLDLPWLSEPARAQLDSMYENRQPLRLSEKIDLSGLGLSEAEQAQLDSIYTAGRVVRTWSFSNRYDLAKHKLEGRVLYWFLAGELIEGFRQGSEAFALALRKWEDFEEINPNPEYTEAVQAALNDALKLQPGQPAPEFTLHDLDGEPVWLSQFKGKVILLDFWASWCGPCISDLPHLRKIKERTAAQPVVFLNLSLDEDDAAWRKAIEKHEIEGVHVRAEGWGSEVARAYSVRALPSYFLVDSQGLILKRLSGIGVNNTDEIAAAIERSL